jgi:tetratricopeptide (TPR) repeat protein
MLQSEHRLAREKFLMAIESLESQQLFGLMSELCSSVAHTWLAEGDYTHATEYAERARDLAEEHNFVSHQAMAWNTLGEIARAGEDYEQAADCYASAVALFEQADNINAHISRSNLALVEVARGNFATARQCLESSANDLTAVGLQSRLTSLFCGLMACAANEDDWDGWEAYRQKALEGIERTSGVDADVVWAARLASDVAVEHGREDLGAQALGLVQLADQ